MNLKKSMISAATAAVLVAGFAGCGESTSTTTGDATGIVSNITSPTGTVSGLVQDTNGNPLSGVSVYLAGAESTTNAGGQYTFTDVAVVAVSTENSHSDTLGHAPLVVTVAAPTLDGVSYLGATTEVTPEAQIDHSNDSTEQENIVEANTNTTFVDGFNVQAGSVVIAALTGTVTGDLRLASNGTGIVGQELCLDLKNVVIDHDFTSEVSTNNSYATQSYCATSGVDGLFTISNVPVDSVLEYNMADYTVTGDEGSWTTGSSYDATGDSSTDNTTVLVQDTVATNVGNVFIAPIVSADQVAPTVASVTGAFAVIGADLDQDATTISTGRVMLQPGITNDFVINFTEAMNADTISTSSVLAYNNSTSKYVEVVGATMSGAALTVTLAENLADAQSLDIYLMRNDYADAAGNPLDMIEVGATTWAISNLSCGTSCVEDAVNFAYCTADTRAMIVQLQAYKELNLNAAAPSSETFVQMELDTDVVRTDGSALEQIEEYSNAFNNVNANDDVTVDINVANLNNTDTDNVAERLEALSDALGKTITVTDDTARIEFFATNASSYTITVSNAAATCTAVDASVTLTPGLCLLPSQLNEGNTSETDSWTLDGADLVENQQINLLLASVNPGDTVTIVPNDDLCKAGTPVSLVLEDNVAPTTILQDSYVGNACISDADNAVTMFGDGGELTNPFGSDATLGMPNLGITPGLLDYLDANGVSILLENNVVAADETLEEELYTHNTINADSTAVDKRYYQDGETYDATAYAIFVTELERTIGVAFSEDLEEAAVPVVYTGTDINTASFAVLNNVVNDDNVNALTDNNESHHPSDKNDLVHFDTTDVISLANNNNGTVIDFSGIRDTATNPNTSDSAKVVVKDLMPPFVVSAYQYQSDLTIEFNEPVILVNPAEPTYIPSITVGTTPKVYNSADWSVSGNTLTIANASIPQNDFNVTNEYAEAIYADSSTGVNAGITALSELKHSIMDFSNIMDANGNSWDTWETALTCNDDDGDLRNDLTASTFAAVLFQTAFEITTNNSSFFFLNDPIEGDAHAQTLVWEFTHALDVNETFGVTLLSTEDGTDVSSTEMEDNWDYIGATTQGLDDANAMRDHFGITNINIALSANTKTLTMTFDQDLADINATGINADDVISYVNPAFDNKIQSAEDEDAENATEQGYLDRN